MSAKVAFVLSQFPALSETFVINQVTGLLDRGVQVEVFAGQPAVQDRTHAEVREYDLIGRTSYGRPVPEGGTARRFLIARMLAGAAVRKARSIDDLSRLMRSGRRDAGTALRFRQLGQMRDRRFDAILCHFGPHGQWGMALRNMGLLSGRLITVFHGYDMSRYLREEGEHVYDRLFREGDLFLPVTEFWRRRLVELGCPSERTVVHRMGVDLDDFDFRPRLPPERGAIRLLTVGRLTEKKGISYGIRAAAELLAAGVEIEYEIVGSGPDREDLQELIRSLGVDDAVRLIGPLPRHEVMKAMARTHVLVAPSVTGADGNQEGLPVVLMEALAMGLPVVSTRHTGIPELIEHGITGMLADERDVYGLVSGLRSLVADPSLYAEITRAGRERVAEQHDIERLNDRLVEIISGAGARGRVRDFASVGEPVPGVSA